MDGIGRYLCSRLLACGCVLMPAATAAAQDHPDAAPSSTPAAKDALAHEEAAPDSSDNRPSLERLLPPSVANTLDVNACAMDQAQKCMMQLRDELNRCMEQIPRVRLELEAVNA